jgi:15-cis-phytoene synthase
VRTATDMYNWTGDQVAKNPMLVFERKLKPTKGRVVRTIVKNSTIFSALDNNKLLP